MVFRSHLHVVRHLILHLLRAIRKLIFLENAQQLLTAHLFGISPDATQHTQQPRTFAVLRWGDILEIIGTAIAPVTVNVVDFIALRTFTYPRECHERVAVHTVEMPHNGVLGAADAVGRAPSFSSDGRERGLQLMKHPTVIRQVLAAWLACSGSKPVVYAVELARPTAIERFVGGASSDDRAVR